MTAASILPRLHATVTAGSAHRNARRRGRGFTLLEIAITLAVLALLIGSMLVPLTTQVEQRQVSDTRKALEEIREALIGFAAAMGYLPCPDVTSGAGANDGVEDVSGGVCVGTGAGNLPWVTLGLGASDAWGNRYRYRVVAGFASRAPAAKFNLGSAADLDVYTSAAETTRLTAASPDGVVAVILSHGRKGYGAVRATPGTNPAPPASNADEQENTGGSSYVKRTHTGIRTPCSDTVAGQPLCEFDDVVIWLGKFTLFERMVAAGKLP